MFAIWDIKSEVMFDVVIEFEMYWAKLMTGEKLRSVMWRNKRDML